MPVANKKQWDSIRTGITALYKRMAAIQPQVGLTHQDVLDCFVPEHQHGILKSAAEVAMVSHNARWITFEVPGIYDGVDGPKAAVFMAGDSAPLTPRYPNWQPNCDPLIHAKLTSWVTERLKLQRQFGVVEFVVNRLGTELDNGKQLRYAWPSALMLAKNATDENKELAFDWAMKYSSFKPTTLPTFDVGFRTLMREAAAIVATASLLTDDVLNINANEPQVRIKLGAYSYAEMHGCKFLRFGYHLEN